MLGAMRRMALALAVLGGGLGCGGDDPELLCTATAGPALRMSSRMDGPGLPSATWRWDERAIREHTTYAYDDAGRLIERSVDTGAQPQGPDGQLESITTIAYLGATATATTDHPTTGNPRAVVTYSFDDAGRPVRIAKDFLVLDEILAFQYDGEGRILVADEQGLPSLPRQRYTEYVYGAGGWPSSMRATLDGTTYDSTFEYEEAPGRIVVKAFVDGVLENVHAYEHDDAGRLTRVEHTPFPERNLEITYAADGAVSALAGGLLHTYSAGCGVTFEVPRARAAPRGPGPDGHYVLPAVSTPWVTESRIAF